MAVIFLDIEKATDFMWKEGLLMEMSKLGVGGNMYNLSFIKSYNQG